MRGSDVRDAAAHARTIRSSCKLAPRRRCTVVFILFGNETATAASINASPIVGDIHNNDVHMPAMRRRRRRRRLRRLRYVCVVEMCDVCEMFECVALKRQPDTRHMCRSLARANDERRRRRRYMVDYYKKVCGRCSTFGVCKQFAYYAVVYSRPTDFVCSGC